MRKFLLVTVAIAAVFIPVTMAIDLISETLDTRWSTNADPAAGAGGSIGNEDHSRALCSAGSSCNTLDTAPYTFIWDGCYNSISGTYDFIINDGVPNQVIQTIDFGTCGITPVCDFTALSVILRRVLNGPSHTISVMDRTGPVTGQTATSSMWIAPAPRSPRLITSTVLPGWPWIRPIIIFGS